MKSKFTIAVLFVLVSSIANRSFSQDGYKLPPKSIQDLALAPNESKVQFSSSGDMMIMLEKPDMMGIAQLAEPRIGLAGYRITPKNNSIFNKETYDGITVKNLKTNKEIALQNLPKNLSISDIEWSPNEQYLSFQQINRNGVELWIIDIKNGNCKKLTNSLISDISGKSYQWSSDSKSILAQFVPANRKFPTPSTVPNGPITQQSLGRKAPARTYQNLLASKYDEDLFDYYVKAQLKIVDLNGKETSISAPAIYRTFDYSPDGNYILVRKVVKPYSYTSPAGSFGSTTEIITKQGEPIKTLPNGKFSRNKPTGRDATVNGPRNYAWRTDHPATLFWATANDEGDPSKQASIRDIVYTLSAPFTGEAEKFYECKYRFTGIIWGKSDVAILSQRWGTNTNRIIINPDKKAAVEEDIEKNDNEEEINAAAGNYILTNNKFGRKVLLIDSAKKNYFLYAIGRKYTNEDIIPYLLKWNITTKKKDTVFKSQTPRYEMPINYFSTNSSVIFSRESIEEVPNYFALNLTNKQLSKLTNFQDPYPSLKGVKKQLLYYQRNDGIKLTATLYLPKDYKKENRPLPMLMWAYPREFKTTGAASRITTSPHLYTRINQLSPIYWVTRGYAVLDKADMPVVGVGKNEPNDAYIPQIIENAKAAIKTVSEMGMVDSNRVAVGGHSYGAFMTANLLAHTKMFAAGIASSGAYNRTLTPFGFQGERRDYWKAKDTYNDMSAFNYADQIKSPLLILHGQADDNSGTFPLQSERLFAALQGLGGYSKLVLFPYEEHRYRAKESILHRLYEIDLWLEKYVKNKGKN